MAESASNGAPPPGECDNCEVEVSGGNYCRGCGYYVCDDCDVNQCIPFGGHDVEEHYEEEE